jgi:hypothetical protein
MVMTIFHYRLNCKLMSASPNNHEDMIKYQNQGSKVLRITGALRALKGAQV